MAKETKLHRRYITGFDGLRTIGVLGVILYHLRPEIFRGGYLGVPIFMVVSGYLITDGLLMEFDSNQFIDFKQFFIKRIKRLYPGLIAVLFATSAYIVLFAKELLHNLHWIVATNLAYVYNWWQIFNGQSYFARYANGESPLTHLWTLSIEGQYYLIWPFLVLGLLLLVKHRSKIFNLVFLLAVLSGVWMFVLYQMTASAPGSDPSRLYYGTDTRAFSILIGAALAFIWPSARLSTKVAPAARWVLDITGLLAIVGMLALVLTLDAQSPLVYQGGMFGFSLLTMLLVAVVAHPSGHFNALLSNPVFAWVGSRSYGLYLYQFPVMIFFERHFSDVANHPWLYPLIEVAIIVILTELSYRFIEQPLARFDYHHLGDFFKNLVNPRVHFAGARLVTLISLVILVVGAVGIGLAPGVKSTADDSPLAAQLKKNKDDDKKKQAELAKARASLKAASEAKKNSAKSVSLSLSESRAEESRAKEHPINQDYEQYGLTQVQLQRLQNIGATFIGDSVMLDAKPELQKLMPKAYVDAAVSRQMANAVGIVQNYANTGALADNVVVGLGTNGPFSDAQFDAMMQAIGKTRHVYWINVHVPTKPWQGAVNSVLTKMTGTYQNLTIIDWYGTANGHSDWFYADNVHMNQIGNPYYAALIAKTMVTTVAVK